MSNQDEPVDLAAFRVRREEREREQRRKSAGETGLDYGRVIPPPLNCDIPGMVTKVRGCYDALNQWVVNFQNEIAELIGAGRLDPAERPSLSEHYADLQKAVAEAILDTPKGDPGAHVNDYRDDGDWNRRAVHRFADHAKFVYAVGNRDIAALQYRLSEMAHTGRLDLDAHKLLQWDHCTAMWEALYFGTLSALHDQRTWDGAWGWYDNTFSDGRQVMVQARMKNWMDLDRDWPYNAGMSGDGPIVEHPRGSLCQIFPVVDPHGSDYCDYPSMEMDLEGLLEQLGPPQAGRATKPESATGGQ
ncbi:MAG: hypothetical protein WD118_05755 [Phycisphaeraceae bacterium]